MNARREFTHRGELEEFQQRRLRAMVRVLQDANPFYRSKLERTGLELPVGETLDLTALPFTTKQELAADQERHPPFGSNLTYPLERYTRLHQTSGTTGEPIRWLDTSESWQWFLDCWKQVLLAAGVEPSDRVYVAFSFGPFIGFWGGFEAAQQLGAMTLSGGALSTDQRLDQILRYDVTVVVCTPTYALHLAEVAQRRGLDLHGSAVRLTLHAGEPGASVPNVRQRLEEGWGARVCDHAGATELGAWGLPGDRPDSLSLLESEFIAEVVDPETGEPISPDGGGQRGELVLTNLGRIGSPVLRYRTGDIVHLEREEAGHPPLTRLAGGIVGRADDMLVVRGVNVYPSAIENLVREIPEIVEFQGIVDRSRDLSELTLRIEVQGAEPDVVAGRLQGLLQERLSLRVPVDVVEPESLPRWELKARRFVSE